MIKNVAEKSSNQRGNLRSTRPKRQRVAATAEKKHLRHKISFRDALAAI
jgi:hypothetical protein